MLVGAEAQSKPQSISDKALAKPNFDLATALMENVSPQDGCLIEGLESAQLSIHIYL